MSRFREEVDLISPVAWVIATLVYAAIAAVIYFVALRDANWPAGLELLLAFIAGLPLAIYVLLIGYINSDARRRGMRYIVWTILAALIPNGIGIILYFLLRDPLMKRCPICGTLAKAGYAFCTNCAASLAPACPHCKRGAELNWTHCAYCGGQL